jgi:hypothetical protein
VQSWWTPETLACFAGAEADGFEAADNPGAPTQPTTAVAPIRTTLRPITFMGTTVNAVTAPEQGSS